MAIVFVKISIPNIKIAVLKNLLTFGENTSHKQNPVWRSIFYWLDLNNLISLLQKEHISRKIFKKKHMMNKFKQPNFFQPKCSLPQREHWEPGTSTSRPTPSKTSKVGFNSSSRVFRVVWIYPTTYQSSNQIALCYTIQKTFCGLSTQIIHTYLNHICHGRHKQNPLKKVVWK